MAKFYIDYTVDEIDFTLPARAGCILMELPSSNISVEDLMEIFEKIASKERCSSAEIFIDDISKLHSN